MRNLYDVRAFRDGAETSYGTFTSLADAQDACREARRDFSCEMLARVLLRKFSVSCAIPDWTDVWQSDGRKWKRARLGA
jgi:hypothetical protein